MSKIDNMIFVFVVTVFFVGMSTFIAGVVVLLTRASNNDLNKIAKQTLYLAQKGVTENISGLVGNAANLLDSMNQLTQSTQGVGVLLMVTGMGMMGAGCALVYLFF